MRAEGGREMGNRQPPILKDKEIFISPGPNTGRSLGPSGFAA